jgi:hypothetical protein
MSYERRDFAICACHGDTLVDTAGKVSSIILGIVMGDLHDIYDTKGLGIWDGFEARHSPESCWMIATSGHSASSRAASRKQSYETTIE